MPHDEYERRALLRRKVESAMMNVATALALVFALFALLI